MFVGVWNQRFGQRVTINQQGAQATINSTTMTASSIDIHYVKSITVDDVNGLEGFNSTVYSRHIKIVCKDSEGGTHYHTITVYGGAAGDLDFTFTDKEEK